MKKWNELIYEIKLANDAEVLHKKYCMQDNFTLLLSLDKQNKDVLENILEELPKKEGFSKNFEMFNNRNYILNGTSINYSDKRSKGFAEMFEEKTGEKSNSNASISFHPYCKGYENQIFSNKKTVIEISKRLEEFGIPFESALPASRYEP